MVAHSLAGAVALAFALDYPERVASMVLLAPVSHPWGTGISKIYDLTATPVIGQLFARTIVLPIAWPFLDKFAGLVFAPQPLPPNYVDAAAVALVLRPAEFIANAKDVSHLLDAVAGQYRRYGEIAAPTVIIAGDKDTNVSPQIHSQTLAKELQHGKLIMLPGVGHAVQHAAADLIVSEIDRLAQASR